MTLSLAQKMHDSWPPKLDRLSRDRLLHEFQSAAVFSTDEWQTAELAFYDEELGICVHLRDGNYGEEARGWVRAALEQLPSLDNRILQSCIDEQRQTGHHGRNYQNALSLVTIPNEREISLYYVGTGVNTEWEEKFTRDGDGGWSYVRLS